MESRLKWTDEVFCYLQNEISDSIKKLPTGILQNISEIRISSTGAVSVTAKNKNILLHQIKISKEEIEKIFNNICGGTVYKFENQIKNGYITIAGGHRVGFSGTAVYNNDELLTIKNITSINFRISRQIKNAARELIGHILNKDKIYSALIVSEPGGGKTTILTDLARHISNSGKRCAVIDERGEICSVFNGIAQKEIGELTSVFDGYLKGDGMLMALRSMSPQVIICDEIGSIQDTDAMLEAMNAGVPVISTAHASDEEELLSRPQIEKIIDYGAVDKIVFLKGPEFPGAVKKIIMVNKYDEDNWNSDDCN